MTLKLLKPSNKKIKLKKPYIIKANLYGYLRLEENQFLIHNGKLISFKK